MCRLPQNRRESQLPESGMPATVAIPFSVCSVSSKPVAAAAVCSTAEYFDSVLTTARVAVGTDAAPSMIPSRTASSFFTIIRFLCFFVILISLTESPSSHWETLLIQRTAEACQAYLTHFSRPPYYIYGISGRKVPLYLFGYEVLSPSDSDGCSILPLSEGSCEGSWSDPPGVSS